jgi:hypothetical protein
MLDREVFMRYSTFVVNSGHPLIASPAQAESLTYLFSRAKSFIICRSEKSLCNPFRICSYKTKDLKSFRMCSYRKRYTYPPSSTSSCPRRYPNSAVLRKEAA